VSFAQNVSDFYKDQIRLTYELVEKEVLSEVHAEDILDEIKASAKTEMRMLVQGESLEGEKHIVVFYSMVMENGNLIKDLSLERDTAFAEEIAERITTMKATYVSSSASSNREVYIGGVVVGRIFGTRKSSVSERQGGASEGKTTRIRIQVWGDGMFGSREFNATIDGSTEEAYRIMMDAEKRISKELGSRGLDLESKMDIVYSDGSTEQKVFKGDVDTDLHSKRILEFDLDGKALEAHLGSNSDDDHKKIKTIPVIGIGFSQLSSPDVTEFYNGDDNRFFNWNANLGFRLEYAPVKWFYIPLEARFDFLRFRQKNNTFFEWTKDGTEQVDFADDLQRSSWSMNYSTIQLGIGFDFGEKAFFQRLEMGAYGGYHLGSSTRIRYGDSFTTIRERTRGHFHQEPLRYGFYLALYTDENIQNRISVDRSNVLRDGFGDSFMMVSYTLSVLL
jgi:hypothetical protein